MVIWSKNMFKGNLMLQFSWNFTRGKFLGDEHLTSSSTKMALRINFKLCTHISNRLLHKTVPAFFLIMSYSVFIVITRGALKAYFAWKQLIVDNSKNIWREKNRAYSFVSTENCNSVGAGAQNLGKLASFWPIFDANFTNIWRA